MLRIIILHIFFFSSLIPSFGQSYFQGGFSFSIGKPINRLGLFFQVEKEINDFHLGGRAGLYYYHNGLGTAQKRWETQLGVGIEYSWGADYDSNDLYPLIQRNRNANLGYWYLLYLEKLSAQSTGEIIFNIGNFEMITQNDALAFLGKDKFRTGTVLLAWYQERHRVGLNLQLWTGNPHQPEATRNDPPEGSKMRWGYIDLSKTQYGKRSHGVAALDYSLLFNYGQTAHLKIGIDDEHVRNGIQNKLFHDWLLSFTRLTGVKNRHIPMLDENGMPYLDHERQTLRSSKFFFEVGANIPNFY